MSGHSKWHNIQAKKGKADAARGRIFTKLGREIAVAAKGNPNPETNSKLADVIAKAKANNMPNDNIQRCIKKAAGELGSATYETLVYEGYGVGGSALIINTLTDNKNRTAGDVRSTLSKCGGELGSTGCVSYMFTNRGLLVIERTLELDEDTLTEYAIEAGADDVVTLDDVYEVYTDPSAFSDVRKYLEGKGIEFLEADVRMIPQNKITLNEENTEKFIKLLDKLEELDDVQDVYHNVELPDDEEED
ncbi:MAG TPA: YebC/PmpR family DNA-binding transcriptional regulator [Candidatus Borkfalkia excrementigallinarum]|uniref:Probable transcriptional regulatory protein H9729_03540 n=1 Tax=Candidatus Borkfalkia excrementigallinarum TaxID=2838506 RepID=A0A9D2CSI3_9FIRM|nr:YebC/PmpR family DNA-binding transcriptional regulator [Candidatus Borkfalkia excrementigallinarum]